MPSPESLLTSKRILLLGASGQIGRQVAAKLLLLAPGVQLVQQSRQAMFKPLENWVQFCPTEEIWPQMGHFDVVINAVGAMHPRAGSSLHALHIGIAKSLLRQMEALGHPRLLHISALNAAPGHPTAFLDSKGMADDLLMSYPNCRILRPSIVCTPDTVLSQKLGQLLQFSQIALGKLLVPKGFLQTKVQPIMGSDLADALVELAFVADLPKQQCLDLGGPEALEFGELIKIMAAARSQDYRPVELPKDILEGFVKYFMNVWAPSIMSLDQFFLLFEDNVCPNNDLEELLGRAGKGTRRFWATEAMKRSEAMNLKETSLELA